MEFLSKELIEGKKKIRLYMAGINFLLFVETFLLH